MFSLVINGRRHRVTIGEDGERHYDPPIPDEDQKRYDRNMQEMLDSGCAPGMVTDTSFHANRGTLSQQLGGDDNWAKFITKRAKERGYNPGVNDVYLSQLCRSEVGPGDPQAFIPATEGRKLVEKRLRARGLSSTGCVKVDEHKII